METSVLLGEMGAGLAMGMAALGSSLGVGAAGKAAAGAWAKDAKAGRPLNFSYIILTGMPLSQTIYAFVFVFIALKDSIIGDNALAQTPILAVHGGTFFGLCIAVGIAEMLSAWMQGAIGASACRSLSESDGKGLANMIIAMGMAETVGIFGFVFPMLIAPTV
ncbi:MAG: V-type ATP synthase subunit K [Dehalococcoidia bacterium]